MTVKFKLTGLESIDTFAKEIKTEYRKQVDLANKHGINKTIDLITYGQVNNIKPASVKPTSAVGLAASSLRVPVEHLFYRTFTRNIKVSAGGKGAKPYASVMIRANTMNIVDFLLSGKIAKAKYGFKSRKSKTSGKTKVNMKPYANAARVGGRRSGVVRIAGVAYNNAYIEDGSYRAKSDKINKYYIEKLGANPNKHKLNGSRFMVFQKQSKGQKLPYPSKAIKIKSAVVQRALNSAAKTSVDRYGGKIEELQLKELYKRLKRFGFKIQ